MRSGAGVPLRSPAPFVLSEVEALGAGPSTSLRANGSGRPLSSVILGLTQDPGSRAVVLLALGPDFRQDDAGGEVARFLHPVVTPAEAGVSLLAGVAACTERSQRSLG